MDSKYVRVGRRLGRLANPPHLRPVHAHQHPATSTPLVITPPPQDDAPSASPGFAPPAPAAPRNVKLHNLVTLALRHGHTDCARVVVDALLQGDVFSRSSVVLHLYSVLQVGAVYCTELLHSRWVCGRRWLVCWSQHG